MAATVTWETLRELAAFRAAKGCAVSFYLNLDPRTTPTAADAETRVNSLLAETSKRVTRNDLAHDQKQGLKADLARIRRYFDQELVRDGVRGVAVFTADLDNLWRPLPLADSVADAIKVTEDLYLTPLVPLVGRGEGALVVYVGRERGEIFRLREGHLEPIADRTEEQPGRHDQGGWSQARYQRHIENLVHEHLRDVAAELDRRVRRGIADRIVVVAAEETRAEFMELISKETADAVVGWTSTEAHAGPPELLAKAMPFFEEWRARREQRVLERWREEAGRSGRAAAGWAATLEAASDGRVEVLLYSDGADRTAWRCPACGRLAAEPGTCPLDGTRMEERNEGLDLAVHQTLSNGGTILPVTTAADLGPVEGIGALLRY
jgi:peptide chain release factor subunit 1